MGLLYDNPQYRSEVITPKKQPTKQPGNPLINFLQGLVKPFEKTGRTIGGGAFEAGRAALQPILGDQVYVDKAGKTVENPFLSMQDLKRINEDPRGAIVDQLKASANVASYAVPFGKGANLLTKAVAPGAVVGGAQAFSEENSTPSSIIKGAVTGGATSAALHGLLNLPKVLGEGAASSSNQFNKAQYNLLPKDREKLRLGETTKALADQYGLRNIKEVEKVAPLVTGDTGVITDLTRRAVSQAKPVKVASVNDFAKDLIANKPIIDEGPANRFLEFINRSVKSTAKGDPTKVHKFIQDLGAVGSELGSGNATKSDRALASAYKQVAKELETRLYQQSGADEALISSVIGADDLAKLAKVSPKLAQDVASVNSVKELRSLAAPFVRGAQAAEKTASRNSDRVIGFKDLFAGSLGGILGLPLGGGVQGAVAGVAAQKALESPKVLSGISKALAKAGGLGNLNVSPALETIVGQVGARGASSLLNEESDTDYSNNEDQDSQYNHENIIPLGENSGLEADAEQQQNPFPLEKLITAISADPDNADFYKFVYGEYQKQFSQKKLSASQQKVLSNIANVESQIDQVVEQGLGVIPETNNQLVASLLGLVKGGVGKKVDTKTKVYLDTLRPRAIQLLRGLGEVGALTEQEQEAAVNLLPNVDDTQEGATAKIQSLKELFQRAKQNTLTIGGATGGEDYSALLSMLGGQQ